MLDKNGYPDSGRIVMVPVYRENGYRDIDVRVFVINMGEGTIVA